MPRKISGFQKSSSKVKATRRFWRFFLAILWTRSTFLMSWIGFSGFRPVGGLHGLHPKTEGTLNWYMGILFCSSWCGCDELEVAGSLLIRNELTIRTSTGRSAKSKQLVKSQGVVVVPSFLSVSRREESEEAVIPSGSKRVWVWIQTKMPYKSIIYKIF